LYNFDFDFFLKLTVIVCVKLGSSKYKNDMNQDYLKTGYWREWFYLRGRRRRFMICVVPSGSLFVLPVSLFLVS